MRGWLKRQKHPGWLAIGMDGDQVDLVHVSRSVGGRPQISLCDTYRKEQSDAATLTRLCREFKLDRYRTTTLLSPDEYQMHQLDAPNVSAEELKNAVRWRVKDLIDYPLEDATVDVLDIPVDRNAPARNHSVYAITARNHIIKTRIQPIIDAQIPLEAVDIPELAQRNIAALFEPEGRAVALLAFYAKEGILTFTCGGELYLSRRIEISRAQLLDSDVERRGQLHERIALELQRSLDHFDRQFHYAPVAKVLLAPLPPECGLLEYLTANTYVPVEGIDLAGVADFSAAPELKHPERQAQCLQTIGAALRDELTAAAA